jgi:hypothetical protein
MPTYSGSGLLGLSMFSLPGTMPRMPLPMSMEVTATGPTPSCLLLPNRAYTMTGRKAPYRPMTEGTPARLA